MNRQIILVTGGCGYLGSQLIRDLGTAQRLQGTTIRILDNLSSGSHRALMNLPEEGKYEFIEGDILDPATLRFALRDVTTVVHLAAIVHTPMSFESPTWLAQVNHWGTAHLVEACLETQIQQLIYASSTAVYGPGTHTKGDVCRPQGAYAQSKYDAEKSVQVAAERGLSTTILRFGSLFGQAAVTRFDAVVNRLAYLAGTQRSLTIFGDGHQRRPVIHVRDASTLMMHLVQETMTGTAKQKNENERFSPHHTVEDIVGQNVSVLEIVSAIQAVRPTINVQFTEQDIRTHLSFVVENPRHDSEWWQPQCTLADGIEELLACFQNFYRPSRTI